MSAARPRIDRRAFLALGAGAATALSLPAVASGIPAVRSIDGRAFGTGWSVTLPAGTEFAPLRVSIERLLAGIDNQMSPWRADSDVSRFNRSAAGPHAMPGETVYVASAALSLAKASNGIFDPTVGPLVARWGFGPISGDDHPGWAGIRVEESVIAKLRGGLTLDLCGIAKGYALDRIFSLLVRAGETDFLIDMGGELAAKGRHPSGRPWRVGVEDPRPSFAGIAARLNLEDMAVATSGSRSNAYEVGSRRYSHIIDPYSRQPVESALASVSVIGADSMAADGWATALMAAGPAAGPELARKNAVSALFLMNNRDGLRRILTGAFGNHLV